MNRSVPAVLSVFALAAGCASAAPAPEAPPRPAAIAAPAAPIKGPAGGNPGLSASDDALVRSEPAPRSAPALAAPVSPSCTGAPGAGVDCNGESCCLRLAVPGGDFEMKLDAVGKIEKVHVNG